MRFKATNKRILILRNGELHKVVSIYYFIPTPALITFYGAYNNLGQPIDSCIFVEVRKQVTLKVSKLPRLCTLVQIWEV